MQPDTGFQNSGLDNDEATADGTALIGQSAPSDTRALDPEQRAFAQRIGEDWKRISSRVTELFAAGIGANDPRTQQTVHDHYRWICHFWVPDRDSYLRLAELYVNQPKFRKRIERKKPHGMASYLRDAMTHYAWAQLR